MVLEKGMLNSYNLSQHVIDTLLNFMHENLERMHSISLRTMTKLADLYRLEPSDWARTATNTLIGAK